MCKYQPEWTEVALSGTFASPLTNAGLVCHLTVFAPTELDITLFQESNRYIKSIIMLHLCIMCTKMIETGKIMCFLLDHFYLAIDFKGISSGIFI